IIAIVLSVLGLLAMATYFVRQRALEIAMRKVFGSTVKEIVTRLVVSFLRMVLIAFIISVPVIWYAMSRWLSDYPLRITLGPWIFILAGLLATAIAFVTVYGVSQRAAVADPVEYTAK
ncbi:MAG: FtsX-like permease family protein, partial [Bacteroidales bacterium]